MNWYKKHYNQIKNSLIRTRFIAFYGFRIKKILRIIIKYYIPGASLVILFFSMLYYLSGGLTFIDNKENTLTFLDYYYFSTITFFTVGYGDIHAYTSFAKILVIIQEFISFIILTLFSGFIIPIFFVRRNDVAFHNQLYICFNGNTYTLSFPVLNKGAMFYEMQGSLSLTLRNKGNIVSRYSLINIYTTWFKTFWFCDFEISTENSLDQDYMVLYEVLYLAITEQIHKLSFPKFKLCIHGIDSQTRGVAYFIKEYYINGIQISFSNATDPTGHYTEKMHSCYPPMEDEDLINFMKLFQKLLFPQNQQHKPSVTGLFEIENRHIDESWQNKKNIFIS